MQDKPSVSELLEAVAAFLSEEAAAELEGRKRFHALVAANVVRIVARQAELESAQLETECAALWELLGRTGEPPASGGRYELALELNRELCRRIDAGEADQGEWRDRVIEHLRASVGAKLDVDNPKFPRSHRAERRDPS